MFKSPKETVISKLQILSERQDDIVAAIVFGSIKAKDIFSDIDVFFFTKTPQKYLNEHDEWLSILGTPISKLNTINRIENVMISRVMLDNYVTLDIIPVDYYEFKKANLFFALKNFNATKLIPKKMSAVIDAGLRTFYHYIRNEHLIICDKANIKSVVKNILLHFDDSEHVEFLYLVNQEKFQRNYNEFWQLAFKTIGMIVRGELYYGITINENILKMRLIEMIEWYTFSSENRSDLYYHGKGINHWANESINSQLKSTFSFENQLRSYESVENTVKLYVELSHQLARLHKYALNDVLENKVLQIICEYKASVVSE